MEHLFKADWINLHHFLSYRISFAYWESSFVVKFISWSNGRLIPIWSFFNWRVATFSWTGCLCPFQGSTGPVATLAQAISQVNSREKTKALLLGVCFEQETQLFTYTSPDCKRRQDQSGCVSKKNKRYSHSDTKKTSWDTLHLLFVCLFCLVE